MKLKSTSVIAGICLLGLYSNSVLADTPSANSEQLKEERLVQKLTTRTALLEQEVAELKAELRSLHAQPKAGKKHRSAKAIHTTAAPTKPAEGEINGASLPNTAKGKISPFHPVEVLSDSPLYIGGTPIVASPYIGTPSQFDASDLITFLPKVNTDLLLLRQQQKLQQAYSDYGLPYPNHPFIDISGNLQGIVMQSRPYTESRQSDVDLTAAELDIAAMFNEWITGFMTLEYDNNPPNISKRESRFALGRGFITVGNLNKTPFYGSIGQLFVPFGQYASYMVSDPLTKSLARTKARAVVLGYERNQGANDINISAFTFRGASATNSANGNEINEYGGNIDYTYNSSKWKASVGGSYIANIADSVGMQNIFMSNETLVTRVPAVDIHGSANVGNYTLLAEYLTATQSFSPIDMQFNNNGAKPAAGNIELNYALTMFSKPTAIAAGYAWTQDALALGLPKQRYIATLNTSLWRSTIESLEFRHDVDYNASDTGIKTQTGTGHTSDSITAQLAVFF